MQIKIIADSLSDIPAMLIEKYDIQIVPLTIIFDDGEYKDNVDLNNKEFYEKLRNSKNIPKTSQITPNTFEEVFTESLKYNEQILYIGGSSRATGTYQSAVLAKNNIGDDNIYTFDTMALSYGCGMFVVEAAKLANDNCTMEEILKRLEYIKQNCDYIFTVDTLEYLQKGGRISSTKAAIGTILNIKPILMVQEGLVIQLDSVRGRKKVVEKMIEIIKKRGSNFKNQTIVISHGDNHELLCKVKDAIESELKPKEIILGEVGSTVGTHSGPGIVGVFYLKK